MTEQEAINALRLEGGLEITGKLPRTIEFFKGLDTAIAALEEIQQYRTIGTVQECREAREKQDPVKPMAVMDKSGRKVYECVNCGNDFPVGIVYLKYCPWCGQAQDLEQ